MIVHINPFTNTFDFGADGHLGKIQTIRFLLASYYGEVMMDRDIGWKVPLDKPSNIVENEITRNIIEMIHDWVPGAEVIEVKFERRGTTLIPVLEVVIEDE